MLTGMIACRTVSVMVDMTIGQTVHHGMFSLIITNGEHNSVQFEDRQ